MDSQFETSHNRVDFRFLCHISKERQVSTVRYSHSDVKSILFNVRSFQVKFEKNMVSNTFLSNYFPIYSYC